ncbi:MAG TPA: TspO/MBR family protein [Candidatus Omnitrophota bacterium]|nr:TspO/MBR family protein [Candidatus Omnitrophota bacterium]
MAYHEIVKSDPLKLIISIAGCFLAAVLGSVVTTPNISVWYAFLVKPPLNPPNWIFGPVWTLLYFLMAVAAWLVWRKGLADPNVRDALSIFIVQLVLNVLWSFSFFGVRMPIFGFLVIIGLWVAILATVLRFFKIDRTAGWLMVPYLLWVSFASYLNLGVALLNR